MEKVNIAEKLALFQDHWSPKVVGELNGQHVKLVKFQGEFVWHKHDHEDELFLVVKGRFRMDFRDRQVWLERGRVPDRAQGRRASTPWPTRRSTSCCSSPPRRSTRATCGTSGRWSIPSGFEARRAGNERRRHRGRPPGPARRGDRQRLEPQRHPLVAAPSPRSLRGDQEAGRDGPVQGNWASSGRSRWGGAVLTSAGRSALQGDHPRRRDQPALEGVRAVDPGFRPQRPGPGTAARLPVRRLPPARAGSGGFDRERAKSIMIDEFTRSNARST